MKILRSSLVKTYKTGKARSFGLNHHSPKMSLFFLYNLIFIFLTRQALNKKQGFTFIELIISILITGIIASVLAVSIPSSFVTTKNTEDISKATNLTSKYLETIKSNVSFTSQYDAAIAGTIPPITLSSQYTGNGYYTVNTKITDLESHIINSVNTVTLKEFDVTYKKTGDSKILASLSTIIARP